MKLVERSMRVRRRGGVVFWLTSAVLAGGLVWHAKQYEFLCDDAFISFRYARNLADGHGLVFNPGFERVEGYTNFLWVMVLAGFSVIGVPPESAANALSLACSIGMSFLVTRHCWREASGLRRAWCALIPIAMLAANRTAAAWSTSGLESALFNMLVTAAVLQTVAETRPRFGRSAAFPASAFLFALATLTRPEGLLITSSVYAVTLGRDALGSTFRPRRVIAIGAVYGLLIGGHFIFRQAYYGEWLPNTYYAKVGPAWWSMGATYLYAFALEYALVLWLPVFVAAGVMLLGRRRRMSVLLIAAAIVPHAIYVARLGGDHFEFRPLSYYVPLLAVLFFQALSAWSVSAFRAATGAVYAIACIVAGAVLPWMGHADYPKQYRSGFPGMTPRADMTSELAPRRTGIAAVDAYVAAYNASICELTRHFVGVRVEEHRLLASELEEQAVWLASLRDRQLLPRDLHIAMNCAGIVPYRTGFRMLDKLGLTDAPTARQNLAVGARRMSAHEKHAPLSRGREMNVDLWDRLGSQLVVDRAHPVLLLLAQMGDAFAEPAYVADVGDGRVILTAAPIGPEALRERMPRLHFVSVKSFLPELLSGDDRGFQFVPVERQRGGPYDMTYLEQAIFLAERRDFASARVHLRRAIVTNAQNSRAREMLARLPTQ